MRQCSIHNYISSFDTLFVFDSEQKIHNPLVFNCANKNISNLLLGIASADLHLYHIHLAICLVDLQYRLITLESLYRSLTA